MHYSCILTHQHSPINIHPSTFIHPSINTHPSTLTHQHSTINTHPSTLTHQHSPINTQPLTLTHQHSTINTQPSTLTLSSCTNLQSLSDGKSLTDATLPLSNGCHHSVGHCHLVCHVLVSEHLQSSPPRHQ